MTRSIGGRLMLLAGRSHPELAKKIAKKLGVPLSKIELGNFANGEISCRIDESVRGCDVFVIQPHASPVNDSIIEQVLIIDAAKRSSAKSITAVCPFLAYARQDRKSYGREPIAARVIVDLLADAGADRIMSVDLHSGQSQGFFDGPFDHLIAMPALLKFIKGLKAKDLVIVSPDAGRVKLAERYASLLGCDMAIIHKQRSKTVRNQVETRYLIGDVKDRTCVLADDMIDTAGTLCAAAQLLAKKGAKDIYAVATHGLFSDPATERIKESHFTKIVVTDSLPLDPKLKNNPKIKVVSIAPLVAAAINAVVSGGSISALFGGRNQF